MRKERTNVAFSDPRIFNFTRYYYKEKESDRISKINQQIDYIDYAIYAHHD